MVHVCFCNTPSRRKLIGEDPWHRQFMSQKVFLQQSASGPARISRAFKQLAKPSGKAISLPHRSLTWTLEKLKVTMCLKFTLQGTNISLKNGILKMIFLFPRWDMSVPWRVTAIDLPIIIFQDLCQGCRSLVPWLTDGWWLWCAITSRCNPSMVFFGRGEFLPKWHHNSTYPDNPELKSQNISKTELLRSTSNFPKLPNSP